MSRRLCPSATCDEDAILLGVVGPDGRVGFLEQEVRVDRDFVETASAGRNPRQRFRFARPCAGQGCPRWADGRCGVIDAVLESEETLTARSSSAELPACSIRSSCRWFAQAGEEACHVCPLVVTDVDPRPGSRAARPQPRGTIEATT